MIADAVGATAWADSSPDLSGTKLVSTSAADRLALLDHEWVPGSEVDLIGSPPVLQTHGEVVAVIDSMVPRLIGASGDDPVVLGIGPLHDQSWLDIFHAGLAVGATILIDNSSPAGSIPDDLRLDHPKRLDGTDEVIVVSGLPVSASEVEGVLASHAMVGAVSVVGGSLRTSLRPGCPPSTSGRSSSAS